MRALASLMQRAYPCCSIGEDRPADRYNGSQRILPVEQKLVPELRDKGINILSPGELDQFQTDYLSDYFDSVIYPVLTPMAVDPGRPFPLIQNKTLNIGVLIHNSAPDEEDIFATVQVPPIFSRLVELEGSGKKTFILMEDVISMFIDRLFMGKRIKAACAYRVTRNGDLAIDEDEAEDLLIEIENLSNKGSGVRR